MFLKRTEGKHIPILVAIGANLPDHTGAPPLQIAERAARAIASIPGLQGPVRSRWFASAPIPASDQPTYINGVLRVEGKITPHDLLSALQAIETAEGRIRTVPNAPRTLDLDIVAMGDLLRESPDPILPHPRAHLRAFVLLPLRDVAPGWVHPRLGTPLQTLIHQLPMQDIRPLSARDWLASPASAP